MLFPELWLAVSIAHSRRDTRTCQRDNDRQRLSAAKALTVDRIWPRLVVARPTRSSGLDLGHFWKTRCQILLNGGELLSARQRVSC